MITRENKTDQYQWQVSKVFTHVKENLKS